MMRKAFTFTLTILIMGSTLLPPSKAVSVFTVLDSVWGTPTNAVEAGPGDQNIPLTVILQYYSSNTATSIQASLNLPQGFTDTKGASTAAAYTVGVASNAIFQLTFNLNIASSVNVATYTIPLSISWNTTASRGLTEAVNVPVQLKGRVKLNFEASQTYLTPGQVNNILVTLSNTGSGDASEVSTSVSSPAQVSILNHPATVSKISRASSVKMNVSVYVASSAAGSPIQLTFTATYKDAYLNSRSFSQNLGFAVKPLEQPYFTLSASPQTLVVGETNTVTLTLTNPSAVEMKSTFLTVNTQPPVTLMDSDGRFSVETISPLRTASVNVNLYVSFAAASPISITVTVSYLDPAGTQRSETRTLSFFAVKPLEQPFFTLSASQQTLVVGETNTVTLTLTNPSAVEMKNTFLTVNTQPPITLTDSDGRFSVGTVSLFKAVNINVNLYVSSTAATSPTSITVTVSYLDPAGTQRSETRTLSFFLTAPSGRFQVLDATWGTASNPVEAGSGDLNVPLTLTIQYFGSISVQSLHSVLTLPNAFTDVNGGRSASAYTTNIPGNSIFQLQFTLNVAANAPIDSYTIPVALRWNTTLNRGLVQTEKVTVYLKGRVKLAISSESVLAPGQVNTASVRLTNQGSGSASQISVTVSTPQQVSLLSQPSTLSSFEPGGKYDIPLQIDVSAASAGAPVTLTFTVAYKDAYGSSRTYTQTLGFNVKNVEPTFFKILVSTDSVNSGEVKPVRFTVQNTGSVAVEDLFATLTAQSSLNLIETDGKFSLGLLKPGGSAEFSANLYTTSTASSTSLTLTLTYTDTSGVTRSESRTLTFLINPKILSPLTVEISSSSLTAGRLNEITVNLRNQRNATLTNLSVATTLQGSQLTLIGSSLLQVGRLQPLETRTFNLKISVGNLQASTTGSLQLTMSYTDENGVQRTETQSFGLTVDIQPRASPLSLTVQPTTLVAGKVNNLTVTATNTGDSPLKTISISFAFAGGQVTWLQPDIVQDDLLLPGESITVAAKVYDPPLAPASTTLQTSLKYYDNNNVFNQETRSIGLLSKGIIELILVDVTTIPEQPAPGQAFSITATLTNTGTITASAVTVTPQPPPGIRIFGSRSVFIGDMQVNTPTTFTLSLLVANTTTADRYQIPVRIAYFDNLRNVLSLTANLNVNVREGNVQIRSTPRQGAAGLEFSALLPYVGVAVAVGGAGFLLGRRFRRG